jgi:hypothetical protein
MAGSAFVTHRPKMNPPMKTTIPASRLSKRLNTPTAPTQTTGWLGGELVDRLGVGVDRGAHLDAPSSLSGRPAAETPTARETRRAA